MRILVAEYASALGMGGTCELEGRAMLSTLVESFERSGHSAAYATHGPRIKAGATAFWWTTRRSSRYCWKR